MSEVLQANIFFLITGIAVIVFTFLLCVALYHFIRILKSLRRVMDRLENGSAIIASDLERLHAFFTDEGFLMRIIDAMMGRRPPKGGRTSRQSDAPPQSERKQQRTELTIKGE